MVVQNVKRKGDSLEIIGQMMGAWPSKMYITRREFLNMLPLVLNLEVITYVLLYPFFCLKTLFHRKNMDES